MRKKTVLLSLLFIVALFCGCGEAENRNIASEPPAPASEVLPDTYAPDGENLRFLENVEIQPAADGFFIGGATIKFYDLAVQKSFVVCSQPGCSHTDDGCPAYLGPGAKYVIYHDSFYVLEAVNDSDAVRKWVLRTRGASDTSWKALWQYEEAPLAGENVQARIGGGYIVVLMNEFVAEGEETLTYTQLTAIDLATGTATDIMPRHEVLLGAYNLLGVAEGTAILSYSGLTEQAYSYEEYLENAGSEDNDKTLEDWFSYLNEQCTQKLTAFDLASGETTEIAEGGSNKLPMLTDPHVVYNGSFFFYYDGKLMSYDIKDGAVKELLAVPDWINLFAMDGKLFYITKDGSGVFDVRCYDLSTGKDSNLKNSTDDGGMVFSVSAENETLFFGLYNGEHYVISKEDFYSGDYEKAKKLEYS